MDNSTHDESLEPDKLPQNETFIKKEVYQQKQPADAGKPMTGDEDKKDSKQTGEHVKEEEKSSKEEGLNQERSAGDAGAFEGFEDQQKAV